MLRGAQQLHQKMFRNFVAQAGVTVDVRQPSTPTPADDPADKVLGRRAQVAPSPAVGRTDPIDGVWSTDYATLLRMAPAIPAAIAALGKADDMDAVFRCELGPVLLDVAKPNSRTLFDTAMDVLYAGDTYRVVRTARGGLPGVNGQYILWVVLKKIGGP